MRERGWEREEGGERGRKGDGERKRDREWYESKVLKVKVMLVV